jgi:hypothetical protein
MTHAADHAALMAAHGLRADDPLMRLNARIRARLAGVPPVRAQDAAAALLADLAKVRTGSLLHLAVDLAPDEDLPTAFPVAPGSAGAAWNLAPAPGAPPEAGRRAWLSCRASPLWVDWTASLLARVSGMDGAVLLRGGTRIEACRAHDPSLPRLLSPPARPALAGGRAPERLLWSRAELAARDVGELARLAGVRMADAPLPDGIGAVVAIGEQGDVSVAGDREGMVAAYRADLSVRTLVALPGSADLRALARPGWPARLLAPDGPRPAAPGSR